MSKEVEAFESHIAEHSCGTGDRESPSYTGGIFHCPEGYRLWDAIDRDDPDFPVPVG